MKDKINRLAEGKFIYERSAVTVEPEKLEDSVFRGDVYEGSIVISNEKRRFMKGIVTTHSMEVRLQDNNFSGVDNEVHFQIQVPDRGDDKIFESTLQVISDQGICKVPIRLELTTPSYRYNGKVIDGWKDFVALAQSDFEEAMRLFELPIFYEQFLYQDKKGKEQYRALQSCRNRSIALEQLLLAKGEKEQIQLSVDPVYRQYDGCRESFSDEIMIRTDTWGYDEILVESDSDFLVAEKQKICTTEFTNGEYCLKITVNPEQMSMGKNFARLDIRTRHQKIRVAIVAVKPGIEHEHAQRNRRKQRTICQLMKRHMAFCMNRLPMQDYLQEMDQLLRGSGVEKDSIYMQLYRIHLAIMEHQTEVVEKGLAAIEPQIEVLYRDAPDIYAGYYYLKGVWSGEEEIVSECVANIRECYEEQGKTWGAFWCLLYLDPEWQNDRVKYDLLLEQLQRGCYSPILYLEVCQLLNDHQEYLMELSEEVVQAMHLGCKNQFLEKEAALRYVYLAGKLKSYSGGILEDMMMLYESYPEDEILTVICKMLIQGQRTGEKAFFWYAKGVEHNLRITELFEYYMYALDEEKEHHFTHAVLLYFLYDNHLTVEKKAMLYAYIVKNKEKDADTYQSYQSMIQNFAMEQLLEGKVSHNLSLLYREFVKEEMLDHALGKKLAGILLKGQIVCEHSDMVGVVVKYPQLQTEDFVPLWKGRAVIPCATEHAEIFLTDRENNLYGDPSLYTLEQFFEAEPLLTVCYQYEKSNPYLLLEMEQYLQEHPTDEVDPLALWQQILEMEQLDTTYRRKLHAKMLRYCYTQGKMGLLEEELLETNWAQVRPEDREAMLEYMALCGCYDKAMEGVLAFGYRGIPIKRLQTISAETFDKIAGIPNDQMLCIGWRLFSEDACGEPVLRYLVRYYSGTVEELIQLYHKAKDAGVDVRDLQERLIAQSLFSEEIVPEIFEIFLDYIPIAENKQVVQAFKKWMAYEYLLRQRELPKSLFEVYRKDVQIQQNLPCLLAVLKYLSKKKSLTEEEVQFADYHVNRLWEQKMYFSFFQGFAGCFTMPANLLDQVCIDFIADPDCEVFIHYRIYDGDEKGKFRQEKLQDMFAGIHVKAFMLFQDEVLEYYITEQRASGETVHEKHTVTMNNASERVCQSSRYCRLNEMMEAKKQGEEERLVDLMEQFALDKEIAGAMFQPM